MAVIHRFRATRSHFGSSTQFIAELRASILVRLEDCTHKIAYRYRRGAYRTLRETLRRALVALDATTPQKREAIASQSAARFKTQLRQIRARRASYAAAA